MKNRSRPATASEALSTENDRRFWSSTVTRRLNGRSCIRAGGTMYRDYVDGHRVHVSNAGD